MSPQTSLSRKYLQPQMELALISQNSLILGPIGYNVRMINSELEELELEERLTPTSHQEIPVHFSDNITHLLPVERNIPPYDPDREKEENFTWDILREEGVPVKVVLNYVTVPRTLEEVKETRRQEIAPVRREKENKIISLTVNDREIQVSTSREERALLTSKIISSPGPYRFKFRETWVEVTSRELAYIAQEIDKVVQDAFDWEYDKIREIDACETVEEVFDVVVREMGDKSGLGVRGNE